MEHIMGPYARPGMRVLDAGSGSGYFTRFFMGRAAEVTALESSAAGLELTRKTTEGRARAYVLADLLDPETPKTFADSFDLIFSDGLLEHFSTEEQFSLLDAFRAMLAEGGRAIHFVPNIWSPWQILRPLYFRGIKERPFTRAGLVALHEKGDWEVETSGGVSVLPVPWSPEQLGGRIGMLVYVVARPR
jgi:cyclopropane fatty-acyl-phospholipid synthase-like methyltransferase